MSFRYEHYGHCPVCGRPTAFLARDPWFRDHLTCIRCNAVPRERALMLALSEHVPAWPTLRLHESSPGGRAVSRRLQAECPAYTPTQYHPGHPPGALVHGTRNEDLEHQTFPDASFDVVLSIDVMEHLFDPAQACREIARTLAPGGHHIFTTPTYPQPHSIPRARRTPSGIEHLLEPEYHGNPVDPNGSLATFNYGADLAANVAEWSAMDVRVTRFADPHAGLLGAMTEVYVCRKPATPDPPGPFIQPATDTNFSEPHYLAANPDVAAALSSGALPSGLQHFRDHGRQEGRQQLNPESGLLPPPLAQHPP